MSTIHGTDSTLVGSYQPIMLNGLDVRFGTSDTERMRIASNGTVTFSRDISINSASGPGNTQGFIFFNNSGNNSGSRNWKISNDQNLWGDFVIQYSSTQTGITSNTAIQINSNGYVNKPSQPAFKAGRSSSITVGNNSTIVFNDTGGNHFNIGGHYNTSNGMFTAPIAGRYVFSAVVIYQSLSNGQTMDDCFYIYKNSTLVAYSFRRAEYEAGYTGNGGYYVDHANTLLDLAAGDTVSIRNGRQLEVHGNTNYCFFYGYMLG
jgi:hypothetical protein